jgi:hypothetical protein
MAGIAYGRRDRPTSGAVYDPRPRAADADTNDRLRPMMMEFAMLPDSRYHYPDRCLPQDGDGDGRSKREQSIGELAMLSDSRRGDPDGPLPATG